jgi:hypothetical protein
MQLICCVTPVLLFLRVWKLYQRCYTSDAGIQLQLRIASRESRCPISNSRKGTPASLAAGEHHGVKDFYALFVEHLQICNVTPLLWIGNTCQKNTSVILLINICWKIIVSWYVLDYKWIIHLLIRLSCWVWLIGVE